MFSTENLTISTFLIKLHTVAARPSAVVFSRRGGAAAALAIVVPYLKRICARFLLFAYALLLLKPGAPVIRDKMAHALWAESHFRMVHSHNGNAHVHQEIKKIVKEEEGNKSGGRHKAGEDIPAHIATFSLLQIHRPPVHAVPAYAVYRFSCPAVFGTRDYPPPEA